MALTGQLSDLSLAELIEFFCNQRKTGRLKVVYPNFPGYFYIQAGALVDAKIGALRGVEAIYYALTLPNAEFKFSAASEPKVRTIYQPWTQVVLEGLRRMDEGISPTKEAMVGDGTDVYDDDDKEEDALLSSEEIEAAIAPLSMTVDTATASGGGKKKAMYAGVAAAVLLSVAAIGFPAGWYSRSRQPAATIAPVSVNSNANDAQAASSERANTSATNSEQPATSAQPNDPNAAAAALAQKREREARERERAKAAAEAKNNAELSDPLANAASKPINSSFPDAAKKPEAAKPGPKVATVTVTYDEAGRVTQASGSDPTALRIARQKRFPAGKSGSTTITIPIN